MRVMVTGATAPLGAALVEALLATAGVEFVLAVGREHDTALPPDPRLLYRTVDLTRPRALHDLVWGDARERGVEAIVHGIQHRRVRDRGAPIHAQNVEATRELLLACAGHPTIRRLVYRSFAEVYALDHAASNVLDEEAALDFDPSSPQWVRDRVEADLLVCAHLGGLLQVAVLRCAEVFAPEMGSQLWDYLQSRICLRPFGFDPMVNVLSLDDAVAALVAALQGSATGVFNIPGCDTLPLSSVIAESRRADVPVPGPLMAPLYGLRHWATGFEFRYDMNFQRFHFGGVLDGTRAHMALGYVPRTRVSWPRPWWSMLVERLAAEQERLR
ncbi:MAG TPA: NAD-dependent epimerase/dehydratase family protein [Kofleriaceae bacterium]|jgi:nucleoside-diphosphate-sugar epimerase|nr:NAD-dependent epimerase/dehydratase family protein [Kofleriaceae bacterium]